MEPKPVVFTATETSDYSGPEPQPFTAVGGFPGTLIEDPNDPGTYIIVGAN